MSLQNFQYPLVSVIIRTYRWQKTLARALQSVYNQDYPSLQVVVVMDETHNKETEAIIDKFRHQDSTLIFIKNTKTLYQTQTLIVWRKYSQYARYIAILDDDDYRIDSKKISQQVIYLESHPDCAIVWTHTEIVDLSEKTLFIRKDPPEDMSIRRYMLEWSQYIHSSVLWRTAAVDSLGWYLTKRNGAEDYECMLRVGTSYKFGMLSAVMTAYTINPKGVTRQKMFAQCLLSLRLAFIYRHHYPRDRKTFFKPWLRYIKHLLSI